MSELNIGNTSFLIESTIERCPNTMMLRELVKNAIEAANTSKDKKIRIYKTEEKLSIWNTGRGMSATELRNACNLAQSYRKINSLDENFGMGAKVASLSVNKHGIRFRSCHNGIVSEVVMGKGKDRAGIEKYMRFDYDAPSTGTEFKDVADVTRHIKKENSKLLGFDWTEVVLFGDNPEQNTVKDPFNSNPKVPKLWIADSLYHRFYRLDKNLQISLDDGTQAKGGTRTFKTFPEVLEKANEKFPDKVKFETININNEIKIHYSYDAPNLSNQHSHTYNFTSSSDISFSGIVYKGEIYDFRKSNKWYNLAPSLGIPFGQKHICILVELNEDANVQPEGYREELRWNDQEKRKVVMEQFADEIIENIPEWLKKIIDNHSPKPSTSEDIKDQLRKLIQSLNLIDKSNFQKKDGPIKGDIDTNKILIQNIRDGEQKNLVKKEKLRRPLTDLGGEVSIVKQDRLVPIPDFFLIRTEKELEEHIDLVGRAAKYVQTTNRAFINMQYDAPIKMFNFFETEYAFVQDKQFLRDQLQVVIDNCFQLIIGKAIIFALIKRTNTHWDEEDIQKSLSNESLSIISDGWMNEITPIKQKIGNILKQVKAASA